MRESCVPRVQAAGAGKFALTANPTLCITPYGTNPNTGLPALALEACSPTNRNQEFIWWSG
jgi:hypothetical protein